MGGSSRTCRRRGICVLHQRVRFRLVECRVFSSWKRYRDDEDKATGSSSAEYPLPSDHYQKCQVFPGIRGAQHLKGKEQILENPLNSLALNLAEPNNLLPELLTNHEHAQNIKISLVAARITIFLIHSEHTKASSITLGSKKATN